MKARRTTRVVGAGSSVLSKAAAAVGIVVASLIVATIPVDGQDKKKDSTKASGPISFARGVPPFLRARGEPCHYPKDAKGKLDVSSYKSLLKGGKSKDFIVAGDPDKSLLIKDIVGKDPPMPKNANPLTPEQIEIISRWIKEGAKNN